MKDVGLKQNEWSEVWNEFDKRFGNKDFQPRDQVQKKWIQQLVQQKIRAKALKQLVLLGSEAAHD